MKKTTKKKPVAKKKVSKKKVVKKTKIAAKKPTKKRKAKDLSAEIIFDSTIGRTDALFVSDPAPVQPGMVQPVNPRGIDPAIDEALKEFDDLEKAQNNLEVESLDATEAPVTQKAEMPTAQLPQNIPNNSMPMQNPAVQPKKSFWKRIFGK